MMKRKYEQGEPIMSWIAAGPFELDVSDDFQDNYSVPFAPYKEYLDAAAENLPAAPKEGDNQTLYGAAKQWRLYRANAVDKKLVWAEVGVHARLMSTYASTTLIAEAKGEYSFKLRLTGSVIVYLSGVEIFRHLELGRFESSHIITFDLNAGANEITIILMNVHMHCTNAFSLTPDKNGVLAALQLIETRESRKNIESLLDGFYLADTVIESGAPVILRSGEELAENMDFFWYLTDAKSGMTLEGKIPPGPASLDCALLGFELLPDKYALGIYYKEPGGEAVYGGELSFEVISFIPNPPECAALQRRKFLLDHFASEPSSGRASNFVYHELSKLLSGNNDNFSEENVQKTIDYVNKRYDCADFAMHGILRLYIRFAGKGVLSRELERRLKDCILGFRYSEDEGGKSMMFMRSENHEMLFCSAEYIAGLIFPNEIFPNSGQNGLFHAFKGRLGCENWIREKGMYGFTEWHSNTYYEENILSLLSIYDFGRDNGAIRILAGNLLHFICMLIASHSMNGVMAGTHGRCYESTLIHPETESMSRINWLLFAAPKRLISKLSIGAVALADSAYQPPQKALEAAGRKTPLWTKTQMGLFRHKGLGGVDCSSYRTEDYLLSGMHLSKAGEFGAQVNAGQALLAGEVPVFVTCFDNRSKITRPSYFGGQYRIPKTIAYKNVMAHIYRIDTEAGFTHCYFPIEDMDRTQASGKWHFGSKGNAYIAVYSQKPCRLTAGGDYRNKELLCLEKDNIWIVEMGSLAENGSFDAFIDAVSRAELSDAGDALYNSPSIGRLFLSWDSVCTLNGDELQGGFPLFENEFGRGEYGGKQFSIHNGPSLLFGA